MNWWWCIKWHFELGLTSKFSCITSWLRKVSQSQAGILHYKNTYLGQRGTEMYIALLTHKDTDFHNTECSYSGEQEPHSGPNVFMKALKLDSDATTATQYWLDAFCFLFCLMLALLLPLLFIHSSTLPHNEQPVWRGSSPVIHGLTISSIMFTQLTLK